MQIWVLIVAAVVNMALALVILTRATRASSTAYFGISALFISFWAVGTGLMTYASSSNLILLGLLLFLIAPMLTTLYMVMFAKHFSGIDFPKKYLAIAIFATFTGIMAITTLIMVSSADVVVEVNGRGGNVLDFQHGWFMLYGSYFSVMFVVAYAYLLAGLLRTQGRLRKQLKLVLFGIFANSFLALITNIILPTFGNDSLLWLGPTLSIFYIIPTCYAMVKHGLFDIRLALVLTFTYVMSLLVLAILYYIIALAISLLFVRSNLEASFNGIDVAIALLLAFLFQPIRRFFDKITSHVFYQDSYSVDDFFAEFNHTLTSTTDLRELLHRASHKISETIKAGDVSFVVYTSDSRSEQIGTGRYSNISFKDIRWLDLHLEQMATRPKVLTLLDDDSDEQLRRMMVSHRMAMILPLIRQGNHMGYLFLGEHKRSNYSARDIRVVQALADELVVGIQNALSIEQIREINEHLEQRISSATKELRASNNQLQRLDEAKDEFISMASHQLRTPLTSIKGYLSMLIEGDAGEVTKEQKHLLSEAFVSSERMVRLIGDFLNVSRLQTGKFVIDKRPVDLAQLVQRELESLEPNASARGMKFIYKKPKNIPIMELDENKIEQVIMNFADNAIYYSKDKGKIVVTLKKVAGSVEFTVQDYGIGVPKAEQSHLFNKFVRAVNARKVRPDGTGVGLFLAKRVIDEHGGSIIFKSVEDKGSTFGFRMPIPKKS